jgi:hypothetical protein
MRLYELTEDFDLAAWKASLPPGEGEIAYAIHLGRVEEVAVNGKSNSFGGTHEVTITSAGGHQGLLYPTYGVDLFNTKEEAQKALFKDKLAGKHNDGHKAIHQ